MPVAAGLDEGDANRVVVALDQAGIDAAKEPIRPSRGTSASRSRATTSARALATMADEQLPRAEARGVLEAADRGQLVPSQAAEHAQLVAGLAGELEKTLGNIDGVLAARVHLNLPAARSAPRRPSPKATASVLVEHRGTTPPLAPESVQRLVAGGAPGLAPADVAVVFVPRPARAPPAARRRRARRADRRRARLDEHAQVALAGLVLLVLALAAATLALSPRSRARTRARRERASGRTRRPQGRHRIGGDERSSRPARPGQLP